MCLRVNYPLFLSYSSKTRIFCTYFPTNTHISNSKTILPVGDRVVPCGRKWRNQQSLFAIFSNAPKNKLRIPMAHTVCELDCDNFTVHSNTPLQFVTLPTLLCRQGPVFLSRRLDSSWHHTTDSSCNQQRYKYPNQGMEELLIYNSVVGRFSPFLWATKALRVSRGIALLFLAPRHSRWGWGVSPTPRPPLPRGKTRYPLYRRPGGPQGRSGQVRKISPPTRIRSPDRPARSSVAIPTELPGPLYSFVIL